MIVRDEASTLRTCLESIRPHVDELVLVDTGSQDSTPAICREFADTFRVWTECNDSEGRITDFSAPRNYTLSLATQDALCWFDGDDVVRGGENLRKLASAAPGGAAAWSWVCPYEYDRDAAGRVVTLQWRERLVYPRAGWEWRGPVHEGLLGKAGTVPVTMQTDAVTVEHLIRASSKPRDPQRNLRILDGYVRRVGETDPRMLHYLGAELLSNGRIGEACYWFRRHAQLAPWSDERCLSLMHLARVSLAMGDYEQAARWALEASTTKSWPEPYWTMGQAYVAMGQLGIDPDHNLRRGVYFLEQGFRLDTAQAESLLMKDPTARYEAHAWLAPALAQLGRGEEAIRSAEAGLAGKPDHEGLRQNLDNLQRVRVLGQVAQLIERGVVRKEAMPVIQHALAGEFAMERKEEVPVRPQAATSYIAPKVAPGHLRIAFWLGHQLEPWTPETLERDGMGGSETMAWEMSKRLAKLGHDVYVFAHLPPDNAPLRAYDRVEWQDADQFQYHGREWDVLIVSRQAGAVALPHKAKARVLWVHDVHVGEQFTPAEAARYDEIWCLSQWHRSFFLKCYPWLGPGKVKVTRNGINLERFAHPGPAVARKPRAIYSSSPDRGLITAVEAWPRIRELVPDAELHCFYGWENWEKSIELMGDSGHPHCGKAAMVKLREAIARTEGVVMRGRVNQKQLAEEMLQAKVWFYPTWFSETSCITAMEAQAAGLACVCPPLAALAETVPDNRRVWTGDIVRDCAWALQQPRPVGDVLRFSLDTLATEWEARLRELASKVVPDFSEPEAAQ
jgi:glycosyltransferase involved in cell wall biosynthesis